MTLAHALRPLALAGLAALVAAPLCCGPRRTISHARAPVRPALPDGTPENAPTGGATSAPTSSPGAATSSPGASTSTPGAADPLEAARERCVAEINRYRASIGVAPLQRWRGAEACTDEQARLDGISKQAHGAFGKCQEWEQCECPGWDGPPGEMIGDCLKMMWDEGPGGGHHDSMASKDNHFVSCGFHVAADGSWWAVQNYGSGE
jgi:hypothetical protein